MTAPTEEDGPAMNDPPAPPASWGRSLAVIALAQFLSSMAFSFALPFAPYYLQELGVTDPHALNLWVALFWTSASVTVAVFSPIWGAVADRYGRRPMLLRAYLGATVVLTLMGVVGSPFWLIVLRVVQGVLSGTIAASQTLAVASVPRERSGLALGALSSSVFSGALVGAFIGGWCADAFGYRITFVVSGLTMLLSAGLIQIGVRENFTPAARSDGFWASLKPQPGQMRVVLPILALMAVVIFVTQFGTPYVPLLVQEIHGSLQGASLRTGTLFAICGVAGMLSGLLIGWLADRVPPPRIGIWSALVAGALTLPQAFVHSLAMLFGLRFAMTFAAGGLDPVFQIWLSKVTPKECQGLIFGWSATARYVGMGLAPLAGCLAVGTVGLRGLFIWGAVLYGVLAVVIVLTVRRMNRTATSQP